MPKNPLERFGEAAGADPLEIKPWDGVVDVLGVSEVRRQVARAEDLLVLGGPTIQDARLLDGDRPQAGEDVAFGMRAVANDLSVAVAVSDVSMGLDPVGDLGLDRAGEHLASPVSEDLGEDVAAVGQWHGTKIEGRLTHGGVLLCLVGTFGVGETSPRVRRLTFHLYPRNSTIPPDDLDTAHCQIRKLADTLRQQNHLIAKLQHHLGQLLMIGDMHERSPRGI
jgi:hypothetical protein